MKPFLPCLLLLILTQAPAQSIHLFVDSEHVNTRPQTFASIQEAIEELQQIKKRQGHLYDTSYIWMSGGNYTFTESLVLDQRSSGLPGAPVVISASKGEQVNIRGGIDVPANLFELATDPDILIRLLPEARAHVVVADLRKAGIDTLAGIRSQGLNIPIEPAPIELIYNDTLMQIARWPNAGYDTYGKVIDEGSIPRFRGMTLAPGAVPIDPLNPPEKYAKYINDTTNRPGSVLYLGDRPQQWTKATDLWLFGWWREPWASQTLKVKYLDTEKREFGFEQPHHYGLADSGLYYAFNLLEEIDQPGEYYIEREKGLLYFWPTSSLETSTSTLSLLEQPLFYLDHTSHIILRNLHLEITRGNGIEIAGGNDNKVEHCILRNIGLNGINIHNGRTICQQHEVIHCEFYFIPGFALKINGGNRAQLIPGGNRAVHNHFHDEARVSVQGVGNYFGHNLSHDISNNALTWGGNDHLLEYNEFHHCMADGDDAGVMYTGRNPSSQGTIIRYNYLHHNGARETLATGSNGIYLDDGTTGQIIYGNVLYKTGKAARAKMGALFLHGAKENLIVNNIFVDCDIAIGFSPWPQGRWEKFLRAGDMIEKLYKEVNIEKDLYTQRYPNLDRLEGAASINQIHSNLSVRCKEFLSFPLGRFVQQNTADNHEIADSDFLLDFDESEFTSGRAFKVFARIPNFKSIPFKKIGMNR